MTTRRWLWPAAIMLVAVAGAVAALAFPAAGIAVSLFAIIHLATRPRTGDV